MTVAAPRPELRVPMKAPQVDPERVVLGLMLADISTVKDMKDRLTAEDFSLPAHGITFKTICDLEGKGLPVDRASVLVELGKRAKADYATPGHGVTFADLDSWQEAAPSQGMAGHFAAEVRQAADRRKVREALTSARAALDGGKDLAEVAREAVTTLGTLVEQDKQTPVALTPAEEEAFWSARTSLTHVRAAARGRMASPWATLGAVLVRVLSQVGPKYVLPPTIGSHASLNLFLAIVAQSGNGKGAALGAAQDAYTLPEEVTPWPIGTGEGIASAFVRYKAGDNGEPDAHLHTTTAIVVVNEVDRLGALQDRQGSTIMSVLREAWMGESLGALNRGEPLRTGNHTYRLGLVVGVQPENAGPLLSGKEASGGTPQRFLWLPGTDPTIPDETPSAPEALAWEMPAWTTEADGFAPGRYVLDVCPAALSTIRKAHIQRQRGEGDALDGHALLCRLKVAAALGLLHGHTQVDDRDWELAGTVMAVSDRTRASVVEKLRAVDSSRNRARAVANAERSVIVAERTDEDRVRKACRAISDRLGRETGWLVHSDLRTATRRHRDYFHEAISRLIALGEVEMEEIEYNGLAGKQYRRRTTLG
ncbi:DnaB-like helicase N-terminal domain-containing protein [Parafrankia sp. EUN1f]|uniref:DnaB-like helicase N-terminal domain-containing protein n=1 Tax=Parafrankia sp. EUN1f TaxID=102897 RepID=UPI0001C44E13|nr:DnaB-like helicase N-terminal domain-containing protein [Parafrankia sp. EUN1f]EFC84070.1 DnaB domain protein helicase domain protein [Parafrankia sp. EUN1f]